jgi:CRP/FNR family cyclic AMP-dependent transcriptional regulator
MKRAPRAAFDPEVFLAKVGKGRTLADYKKKQTLFSQGDPADAIFYIQTGKVKLTVVSKQGKEAVVAIVGSMTSLEKVA